ncbi:MAG TPA: SNF2-related protein [Acidimicrobiia bacterium]|nr:SNF2-related protein [Acidimicrobiia bacterium]
MLVVHAFWSPGRGFCFWAEDSRLAGRSRRPDEDELGPRRHSFAVASAGLPAVLGLSPEAAARAEPVRLRLLLPTDGNRPSPTTPERGSSGKAAPAKVVPLVRPARRGVRRAPGLHPWLVPTLRLPAGEALELLLSRRAASGSPEREATDAPVSTGEGWAWCAALADEALDMAAGGRAVPAVLRASDGRAEARWLPAPTAADGERLRLLVESIPAVCQAEAAGGRDRPVSSPEEIVTGALGDLVDAAVRASLSGRRSVPPRRGRVAKKTAAAEAFLAALTSDNATLPPETDDGGNVEELQRVLRDWRRSGLSTTGPLRTCFRLVPPARSEPADAEPLDAEPLDDEPANTQPLDDGPLDEKPTDEKPIDDEPDEEPWRVEILLQSTQDPSLLVPAADVWHDGPAFEAFRPLVSEPGAHLRTDLGRAVRLWPGLDAALKTPEPSEVELDAAGAQRFLSDAAPLLEQAGFGILVPPWWRDTPRLGLRLRARSRPAGLSGPTPGGIGLAGLCDYDYEVAVGDTTLTVQELQQLAEAKAPLVRLRGRWVELRAGDIERALAILTRPAQGRSAAHGQMTAAEVLRIGLGLDPPPRLDLPVVGVVADGWLGALLGSDSDGDGTDTRVETRPTPAGFDGVLRPYQERGLAWLSFLQRYGLGACLADDMGLGKTAQLLALMVAEREEADMAGAGGTGKPARPAATLLVCPMSLVGNWQRETERFAPGLVIHVHHGLGRKVGPSLVAAAEKADIVITTYSLLARDKNYLAQINWGRVALDEAQNVKNPLSLAGRAARALPAAARVALTGTPVENRLLELWSLMDFLNPGLLGSEATFRHRFAVPVERYGDEAAAATLKRLTGPFVLRRLKTDRTIIADLPDKIEMHVLCNLTREQASLYRAVVDDMLDRIEKSKTGIERMGIISGSMMKLKQVCNHPAHFLADGSRLDGSRSGKLARLEEILEEVTAAGERALVFTQFAEMGILLQSHLSELLGVELPFLYGAVAKRRREEMVDAFQSDGGPPVLILTLKAGGVGLNLTAANHVVHYDRWWNPAVEDQATDRAFRIGQSRNVQVRKFVCVGTLEERIDAMIEAKRDLAERIVGSGEARLTDLSLAELRDLVALSDDAVAEG